MINRNLEYQNYFRKLNITLKKINNKFLYYIPELYKKDWRQDKISIIKIKFNFFKSLFSKSYLCDDIKKIKEARMCFLSHYVGNQSKDVNLDFYYGNLFKNLRKDEKFYVILINHTNESLVDIKKKFKNSKITRVYVNNNFNFLSDLVITFIITKKFLEFHILKFFNYKKFKSYNKINKNFNYKLFFSSRFTYKITSRIIRILNKSKNLNNMVVTFEGHSFEKIIFNYCKKKSIRSFGYFFSVIREYKNNIYYNFDNKFQPDIVLTAGSIAKKDLKLNSPHKNIEILGTNKHVSKSLKFDILKKKNYITILVCPEGLFSETMEMLKLINNDLLDIDKAKFIFRTHPLIDIYKDFKKIKFNKNINISKEKDIYKDFIKSDVILYSGSSVCIQAIANGLMPINFNSKNNKFSLDPLYKINKFNVNNSLMLKNLIDKTIIHKKKKSFQTKLHKLKKYSNLYFEKFNKDILKKLIQKKFE